MKNHVRRYRIQQRLTQSELARAIGVEPQTISNIETSRHKPRFQTMRDLAEKLGVPIEKLFVEEQEDEQPANRKKIA